MRFYLLGFIMFAAGCTTINVSVAPPSGDGATTITVTSDRNVNTNRSLTTRDVSVPVQ